MHRNNNTWFNLLALVDKSLWNFPSVKVVQALSSWMTHMPLDDCFVRYSHSCFLGLDDPRGQFGVGSIFNSPS